MIGSTAGSPPSIQARTTWFAVAPTSWATSRSTESRVCEAGWSYCGGSGLSGLV